MFETLMKHGGHRVDYLNPAAMGDPNAFGFYVRGELPRLALYSTQAKCHLHGGLAFIKKRMDPRKLVAVYLDIDVLGNLKRPSYQHLKQDMRSGMFRRVFVYSAGDLLGQPAVDADLRNLYCELGGFELVTPEQVENQPFAEAVARWIFNLDCNGSVAVQ